MARELRCLATRGVLASSRLPMSTNSQIFTEHGPVAQATVEAGVRQRPGRSEPRRGDEIAGTYQVLKRIGAGAMGLVFKAYDIELEREVALKILAQRSSNDAYTRACFVTEARAMARVRHPNVVDLYAFREWHGRPVLVMEYIEGCSLASEFVRRRGAPFPLPQVRRLISGMCCGVEAIHDAGSIHRDLKPSNMLMGAHERVAIADFGLALLVEDELERGVAGTPAYMSPESIEAGADGQAMVRLSDDVWAFAVMTYELLTGLQPFAGVDMQEVAAIQARGLPARASYLRSTLPVELDRVLDAALSQERRLRPRSAAEFGEMIDTALAFASWNSETSAALALSQVRLPLPNLRRPC